MSTPYEVLAGPFDIYVAAVGTTIPDVSDETVTGFTKLGASGDDNYDDSGIVLTPASTYSTFTPAGSTAATKVWRQTEALDVSFNLVDMTAAMFAKTLNDASVTAVPASSGVAGQNTVELIQGIEVALFALVARKSGSASGDNFATQFQVPRCYNEGQPTITGKIGTPMALACKFMALKDPTGGFGKYVEQTADASS